MSTVLTRLEAQTSLSRSNENLIDPMVETEMLSINVHEDERTPVFTHAPDCLRSNGLPTCTCDELPILVTAEHSPLIAYQNYSEGADVSYLTDIHCHESKPIYSNARARKKLVIASVVCLLFVIAEVVGEYYFWMEFCALCEWSESVFMCALGCFFSFCISSEGIF